VQRSPETSGSLLRWRLGLFMALQLWVRVRVRWVCSHGCGFTRTDYLQCAGLFAPYQGETTLRASYLSAPWKIYETMYLFRVQGSQCSPWGMGYWLTMHLSLRFPDTTVVLLCRWSLPGNSHLRPSLIPRPSPPSLLPMERSFPGRKGGSISDMFWKKGNGG
jgi:hypothetical protein